MKEVQADDTAPTAGGHSMDDRKCAGYAHCACGASLWVKLVKPLLLLGEASLPGQSPKSSHARSGIVTPP